MPRPKRPAGSARAERRLTVEVKTEAVRLLHERQAAGATLASVCRELDLTPEQLRAWERKGRPAGSGPHPGESEAEELRRLRRENVVLQQEREFLKKATAFFAKEPR